MASRTTPTRSTSTGSVIPSRRALRTTRRSSRRSTYPRPSLPGTTPSPMSIVAVRTWSAMTRKRTPSDSEPPS